jgi:prophage regulatory protein
MFEKSILRAADVASVLSISLPTLYRWIRNGLFPEGIDYGPHCVGWERKTVEDWIASKKKSSSVSAA